MMTITKAIRTMMRIVGAAFLVVGVVDFVLHHSSVLDAVPAIVVFTIGVVLCVTTFFGTEEKDEKVEKK